jgi:hypothetical protein
MGMPVSLDDVRALAGELLRPDRFFAPGRALVCQHIPSETLRWEVFQGRLLDHTQTRQEATLEAWNLYDGRDEPILSLKVDSVQGRLFVVRGVDCHVWEAHAEGNVITSRPAQRRVRELIGIFDLLAFSHVESLGEELASALSRAITGTRLPLTPTEAPHPAFSFGELFCRPAPLGVLTQPRSWSDLLPCWLESALATGQTPRLIEAWLRAVPSGDLPAAATDLQARWSSLGQDVPALLRVLRVMFNEVSLSPWTDLVDKVLRLLALLERGGLFTAGDVIDFEGHLLRLVGRHLTAYDLVMFHHRGSNYPDALLLEAVLNDFLVRLEQAPSLFQGEAGRLRRRALRQGYLLRRRYEGHPVPDMPTSPGEHTRVFPDRYPRVPEEQILQPATRRRRLFAADLLADRLSPAARNLLRQALADLEHPDEMQELAAAVFLDRPLGAGKAPVEPDGTLLLASLAFSCSVARGRLHLLVRDLGAADIHLRTLEERLALPGLGLDRTGPAVRPGSVSLADAARAGPDFVFRHTLPGSVRALREMFDFGPFQSRLEGRVLLARAPAGPALLVHGADWRPILALVPCLENGYASRLGLEYPACGLLVSEGDGPADGTGYRARPTTPPRSR